MLVPRLFRRALAPAIAAIAARPAPAPVVPPVAPIAALIVLLATAPGLASPPIPDVIPADRTSPESADAPRPLEVADALWARRGEGAPRESPGRAAPQPIERAIEAYEVAVDTNPDDLEARWKLLRALWFQGEHVASGVEARRRIFDHGRTVAETGLDRLAVAVAGSGGRAMLDELSPEERAERLRGALGRRGAHQAAGLYFWSSVHQGLWGDAFGRLAAARQGVADAVRDQARTSYVLAPDLERAGALRVLGRLHTLAPRLPFLTGWVDRERAVELLERAVERAPEEPLNRLYLAEVLLEHTDRRDDALAELRALLRRPPDPERPVEEASARLEARHLLSRER